VSGVHFIKTSPFRRVCDALLSLEEFRASQLALYDNPEAERELGKRTRMLIEALS